ncbi:DUF6660 family protein [Parapedobacter sp. DT-150]|uniref:DUF6660 family protein n=1 Tax=Parapedobacter sp. DT-150 TaxID=3396162 RepID=UPI003F1CA300
MKVLRCILLWYVTVLACWPCADTHMEHDHGTEASVTSVADAHAHNHGLCSPFCACGCCGVVLALDHAFISVSKPFDFPVAGNSVAHTFTVPSSIRNAIWQPPQLIG